MVNVEHQSLAVVVCNAPLGGLEGLLRKIWSDCECFLACVVLCQCLNRCISGVCRWWQ